MSRWPWRIVLFLWITYFYHLYRRFSFSLGSLIGLWYIRRSAVMHLWMELDPIPLPCSEYELNVVDQMEESLRDYHAQHHATDKHNPEEYRFCSICIIRCCNDYMYCDTFPKPPCLLADDADIIDSVMHPGLGTFELVNPNELIGMNNAANALVDPYTPFNDHCYYQPKTEALKNEKCGLDSVGASPTASESSGDEIDVVTVADCKEEFQLRSTTRGRRGCKMSGKSSQKGCSINSRTVNLKNRAVRVPKLAKNGGHTTKSKCAKRNLPRSMPNSSRSSSDSEDVGKRNLHNDLERMRRFAQKKALFCLRDAVPHVKASGKTAKVCIISEAATYIRLLTAQAKMMEQKKKAQKQKRDMLVRKLVRLKRSMGDA